MSAELFETIASLRSDVSTADSDTSQAAALKSAVERVHDRLERGTATASATDAATAAFAAYLDGDGRREELTYLTEPLVPTADGDGTETAFEATREPSSASVDALADDFEAFVRYGTGSVEDLVETAESVFASGDVEDVASFASLADRLLHAARRLRETRATMLNETGVTDEEVEDGALSTFLSGVGDEVTALDDQPIALLPIRIETRFVAPNEDRSGSIQDTVDNASEALVNRTDPTRPELRVRVYPGEVHVDSHEPELTPDELAWGKQFWAQCWFACHETIEKERDGEDEPVPTIPYTKALESGMPDDEPIRETVRDMAARRHEFSADPATYHEEVKERAWRQLLDRFGRERSAYVAHTLAPMDDARAILDGWQNGTPPWPRGGEDGDPSPAASDLSFPTVDRRPDSWNQPPQARLLPDRWLVFGEYRPAGQADADLETLRVESDAIREPLYVGPSPENVAADELDADDGEAPEGMEWMIDYEAAESAGMAITITPEDLGGTDPNDVVFERLVVLGVSASMSGAETTDGLADLLEAHHYTDGLELLERGTPTNNHDQDAGYRSSVDPVESMAVELGEPLASFGDFSDGDLLARALGISDPDESHVFSHVEGADRRTQANARHMNSALWPGTIGYYLRNMTSSNRWSIRDSIWADDPDIDVASFPDDPMAALGESLKWTDGMRRHFTKYVRAGGPFPPVRVGTHPYGILPVTSLDDEDDGGLGPPVLDDIWDDVVIDDVWDDWVIPDVPSDDDLTFDYDAIEDVLGGLTHEELAGIDPDILYEIDDAVVDELAADDLQGLSADVLAEVDPTILGELDSDVRREVDAAILSEIGDEVPRDVDQEVLRELDRTVLRELDEDDLRVVTADLLREVDPVVIGEIDTQALGDVDPETIGEIDTDVLADIDPAVLRELDVAIVDALDDEEIRKVSADVVQKADPVVLAEVDATVLDEIEPVVLRNVDSEVLADLDEDVLRELDRYAIRRLDEENLRIVTAEHLREVDPAVLGALDPRVIHSLDARLLARVGDNLRRQDVETLNALDEDVLRELDHAILRELDDDALRAVSADLLREIDPAVLGELDVEILEDATSGDVKENVLDEIGPDVVADLDVTVLRELDREIVRTLDDEDLRAVNADVLRRVNPAVIGALDPALLERVDPDVMAEIHPGIADEIDEAILREVDPAVLRELDREMLNSLDDEDLQTVSADMLRRVDPEVLRRLDPDIYREVDVAILQRIGHDVPRNVDPDVLRELDREIIHALDEDDLQAATADLLREVDPAVLARLDADVLSQIDPDVLSELGDPDVVGDLQDPTIIEALEDPSVLGDLDRGVLRELDRELVAALDEEELRGVSASVLRRTDPDVLAAVDASVLDEVETGVLREVDPNVLADIDADVLRELDRELVGELDDDALRSVNADIIRDVDPDVIGSVSSDRLGDISAEELKGIARMKEHRRRRRRGDRSDDRRRRRQRGGESGDEGSNVARSGYGATVQDHGQSVDHDLFGSSFDPGVPQDEEQSDEDDDEDDDSGRVRFRRPDGRGQTEQTLHPRFFGRDERVPDQISRLLRSIDPAWKNSTDSVDRVTGDDPSDVLERILQREATANEYLTEEVRGYSDVALNHGMDAAEFLTRPQRNTIRNTLKEYDLTELDPRLAWTIPPVDFGFPDTSGPEIEDGDVSWLVDGRADEYLSLLLHEGTGNGLLETNWDYLRYLGHDPRLDAITVDREALADLNIDLPTNVEFMNDEELVTYLILTAPEHGKADELYSMSWTSSSPLNLDPGEIPDGSGAATVVKLITVLQDEDGLGLQNTFFKQLMRFSAQQAYVESRIRLGAMFDEPLVPESGDGLLSAQHHSTTATQQPVPEPSFHDMDTMTVWDALDDTPPTHAPYSDKPYKELIWETCKPGAEGPPIDPRMREFFNSITNLSGLEPETLGRLMGETLDLASHRIDAWWTSLATRRLYEQRERQEVELYDGADYEFVGDHFSGAEGAAGESHEEPVLDDMNVPFGTLDDQWYANPDLPAEMLQASAGSADTDSIAEPATLVGAYGFVEDLSADHVDEGVPAASGGEGAEYIHAPSIQHATTASILRSGRKHHGDSELGRLLDVDLSPGRVRAARSVIEGIRQGQQLGDMLGYRFERRLLERTQAYNEDHDDSINLVQYKWAIRREYPGVEDQLDHDGTGNPGLGDDAAKSDVVAGYDLVDDWQTRSSDDLFFAGIETDDDTLHSDLDDAEREELAGVLEELSDVVDAVADLLVAENVHQLGKGNLERVGGSLDDLLDGDAVAEPEVAQTPRDSLGITHRQFVAFGEPGSEPVPEAWRAETPALSLSSVPNVGLGGTALSTDATAEPVLQSRPTGEPNLNGWVGSLLPSPDRVSCEGVFTWETDRDIAVGTIDAPRAPGTVSVDDLEFEPDLVELTVSRAVGADGTVADEEWGWTHGVAARSSDGETQQRSVSVARDQATDQGIAVVQSDAALRVCGPTDDGTDELIADVSLAADGFDLTFSSVNDPEVDPGPLAVEYRAISLGNPEGVEVGHVSIDSDAGTESVPLDVDADHVTLIGTTIATDIDVKQATPDAVALSHGMAVDDGTIDQHVATTGLDAVSGTPISGASDDRALLLPVVDDGSVVGTTSAEVTGIGEEMELQVTETGDAQGNDESRVLTYVAVQTPESVPTPTVATIAADDVAAGVVTVSTAARSGRLEVLAVPGDESIGSVTQSVTGGFSVGSAVGSTRQRVLAHDGSGTTGKGGYDRGAVGIVPGGGVDGDANTATTVTVSATDEDAITLSMDGTDTEVHLLVRSWPEAPGTVDYEAKTGATLADLQLSPLDALALAQQRQNAGASELETRMSYQLFRNRPAHNPSIPDDATLELAFSSLAPDAIGDDPLTVAQFLEVAGTIRTVLGDGRPLNRRDLRHAGERDERGREAEAAVELADRARAAQSALAAGGTLLENRVERFDVSEEETPITGQVETLYDAVRAVRKTLPIDGATYVGNRVAGKLDEDGARLLDELTAVTSHFPAGPVDPDDADADWTVFPLANQRINGTTAPDASVRVSAWSLGNRGQFSLQSSTTADADGSYEATLDFSDIRPGTRFALVVSADGDVIDATDGRVVLPNDDLVVSPASDQRVRVETDRGPDNTVDVSITTLDGTTTFASTTTTTSPRGWATVDVDFEDASPWTFFTAEVTSEDETVGTARGYVRAAPGTAVEETDVLEPLLWLAMHTDEFDPHGDGPVGRLQELVDGDTLQWDTIRDELDLVRELKTKSEADLPSASDVNAVEALVETRDDKPALESLDLTALDAAVYAATRPLRALSLPDLFDATGRPDRAGVNWFPDHDGIATDRSQRRIAAGLDRPDRLVAGDLDQRGMHPSLSGYISDAAADRLLQGADEARLRAYLTAFADLLPALLPDLDDYLDDAERFARQFDRLLHDPGALPTGADRRTFEADFRTLTRQPVLEYCSAIDRIESLASVHGPSYNLDALLVDGTAGSEADLVADPTPWSVDKLLEGDERPDELSATQRYAAFRRYLNGDDEALALLREYGIDAGDTPPGTVVTDLRFFLETFRQRFFVSYLDERAADPDPQERIDTFADTIVDDAEALATTSQAQHANLAAAGEAGRFDRAFRRGVLEGIRQALIQVSYFDVGASVPRSAVGGSPDDERALCRQAETVLKRVRDAHTRCESLASPRNDDGTVAEPPTLESQVERLEILFGDEFTVLPAFEPSNGAELTRTFDRDDLTGGDPLAAETWFQRISRVRDRTANYRRALSYAEAVTGDRKRDLSVGQVPHRPDELWIGLDEVDPEPGRLSLIGQFGTGFDGDFTGRVTGLYIDDLVETIPEPTETTGVALNYDAPDVAPPHSILLAVPPDDNGWDRSTLESVVTDTMDLLKLRLVDLEDLDTAFDQLLPMIHLPDNDGPVPHAPSVDLDRIERYYDLAPTNAGPPFPVVGERVQLDPDWFQPVDGGDL